MSALDRAGEIDGAQRPAADRVDDRSRRARPRVAAFCEMLGGEDLHRMVLGQRRAERVRPGDSLAPPRAFAKVDVLGRVLP